MDITERARKVFANDRYATEQTGVTIVHAGRDGATCRLEVDSRHRNAKEAVMGGVLFTLADYAFAVAAHGDLLADTPEGEAVMLQWVSSTSNILFLSPTQGGVLTAEATFVKKGRRQVVVQTTISDDRGRTVALVTTTGANIL